MKKDIYSTENDFSNNFESFDKVLHTQVIYNDDRLYQEFVLEWSKYYICDVRHFIKNIQNNVMIMSMLHYVNPLSSYGFGRNKLLITFKKDLKFSKNRANLLIKYVIRIGNKT